jgi:uncharacterized spore protein YtfJ
MNIEEILAQGRDTMTVRRVFGDPIERDGLTVIPVANVMGGGGGGGGMGPFPTGASEAADGVIATTDGPDGDSTVASGSGVGFGVRATPAGVYVINGGEVRWEPAMDLTRVAIMGQLVAIVFLLVVRSVLRSRKGD